MLLAVVLKDMDVWAQPEAVEAVCDVLLHLGPAVIQGALLPQQQQQSPSQQQQQAQQADKTLWYWAMVTMNIVSSVSAVSAANGE
jgi:NAD-dependent oxidoreductase involved in siderophore biosynthesis